MQDAKLVDLIAEAKFTPGPWKADIRTGCCAVYPENRADDTNGCHPQDDRNIFYSWKNAVYSGSNWEMDEEQQHNAHLIAAAPEMFEALLKIYDYIVSNNDTNYLEECIEDMKGIALESIHKALNVQP